MIDIYIIDYDTSYINNNYPTSKDYWEGGIMMKPWWPHDIIKILMYIYELLSPPIKKELNLNIIDIMPVQEFTLSNTYNNIGKLSDYTFNKFKQIRKEYLAIFEKSYVDSSGTYHNPIDNDTLNDINTKYRNILKQLIIDDYNNKNDREINQYNINMYRNMKINKYITNIVSFFKFIMPNGTIGKPNELVLLKNDFDTPYIFYYYQVSPLLGSWNHKYDLNDLLLRFINFT